MKRRMKRFAEGGMSDEERYGKVGAEIRRLDPEAYKNRPRSAEGNLKLLEELRNRAKAKPTVNFAKEGVAPTVDFAKEGRVRPKAGAISADVEPDDTPKVEVEKTKTKVEAPARRATAVRGRGAPGTREIDKQYAENRRSSYLSRLNPLRDNDLGDIFGRRREEGVMRNMGVDRAEAARRLARLDEVRESEGMKRGGRVKKYKSGGSVKSSASRRADGIAQRGKTKGRII